MEHYFIVLQRLVPIVISPLLHTMNCRLFILLLLTGIFLSGCASTESPEPILTLTEVQPSPPVFLDEVDAILSDSLKGFLPPRNEWPVKEDSSPAPEGSLPIRRTIPLSSLADFDRLKPRLWNALEREGFSEFEIGQYPSPGGETWEIQVDSDELITYRIDLVQEIAGRIAIILDDFGNSLRNKEILLGLDYPLTLAILPGLTYSSAVDRLAAENGFEVLLHCPLEAINPDLPLGPGAIHCQTPEDELTRVFDDDISGLPHAVGVNNHMGSAFTTDTVAMRRLLAEVKRNDFFFVDSLTIGGTVTAALAEEMGVDHGSRDVFLDHVNSEEFILQQFEILKRKAKERGSAIAIGHDRPLTLEMLHHLIPTLARDNLKLVFVSNLIFSLKK